MQSRSRTSVISHIAQKNMPVQGSFILILSMMICLKPSDSFAQCEIVNILGSNRYIGEPCDYSGTFLKYGAPCLRPGVPNKALYVLQLRLIEALHDDPDPAVLNQYYHGSYQFPVVVEKASTTPGVPTTWSMSYHIAKVTMTVKYRAAELGIQVFKPIVAVTLNPEDFCEEEMVHPTVGSSPFGLAVTNLANPSSIGDSLAWSIRATGFNCSGYYCYLESNASVNFYNLLPVENVTIMGGQGIFSIPNGSIAGDITSSQAVSTLDGNVLHRAIIEVSTQKGFIRDQNAGESEEEYAAYVQGQTGEIAQTLIFTADMNDHFQMDALPALETFQLRGVKAFRPARYSVTIRHPEADELLQAGADTETLFYTQITIRNLIPDTEDPPQNESFVLNPFDGLGTKLSLVQDLSALGPNHYAASENLVQLYLNQLIGDPGLLTPERLEGLKRAIWAERAVRGGAQFSDELLSLMLEGLANLTNDLASEIDLTSKNLKDKKKTLGQLEGELDAEILANGGWTRFDTTGAGSTATIKSSIEDLLFENPDLKLALLAKYVKYFVKIVFVIVRQAFILVGAETMETDATASMIQTVINTFLDAAITHNFTGGNLGDIVKAAKDDLMDGSGFPYAFTSITNDNLAFSQVQMESWSNFDRAQYRIDRDWGVQVISRMNQAASSTISTVTYTLAFDEGIGLTVDTVGVAGGVTPIGQLTTKLLKVAKYLNNATSFGLPASQVYWSIPNALERATHRFYGDDTYGKRLKTVHPDTRTKTAYLTSTGPWQQARTNLTASLNDLKSNLTSDDIPLAIESASGPIPNTVTNDFNVLMRELNDFVERSFGARFEIASENLQHADLLEGQIQLLADYTNMLNGLDTLFVDILLLQYSGPGDPNYLGDRNAILDRIDTVISKLDDTNAQIVALDTAMQAVAVSPVAVILIEGAVSQSTGLSVISQSPETFTLSAHIRNLSQSSLSNLSAVLTIVDPLNSTNLSGSNEIPVGTGTLANDDMVPNSGSDEADITWDFTYAGAFDDSEVLFFRVDLREAGAAPINFEALTDQWVLSIDVEVVDTDLDGLSNDYETNHGLNPNIDDFNLDLDGDGLSNGREAQLGTHPNMIDSDGDTITDDEELIPGADSLVSSPLFQDTDGDGLNDNVDGQPLDAGESNPLPQPVTPSLIADQDTLFLSPGSDLVTLEVTTSDGLYWTATSSNPEIVSASPHSPGTRKDNGVMIIRSPQGLSYPSSGVIQSKVTLLSVPYGDVQFEINVFSSAINPAFWLALPAWRNANANLCQTSAPDLLNFVAFVNSSFSCL